MEQSTSGADPWSHAIPTVDELDATLKLLSALAHPSRLLVLFALHAHDQLSVAQLSELTGQEQSSMSHQLAVLRKADLIVSERDGKRNLYRLADEHVIGLLQTALDRATGHE